MSDPWSPPPGPSLPTEQPLSGEAPRSRGALVLVIVAAVLMLGVGVAAVVLALGGDSDGDRPAAESTIVPGSVATSAVPAPAPPASGPAATDPPPPTTEPAPSTTVASDPVDLFAGTQAADALGALAAELGTATLRVLDVNLYPSHLIVRALDPAAPANVDRIVWRDGAISDRQPVRLSFADDPAAEQFDTSEVRWEALAGLVEHALDQLAIEGGEVTHVHVARRLPFTPAIEVRVFVTSPRASGFVDAAADGTVLDVNPG